MPTRESYLIIGGASHFGETVVGQLLARGEMRVAIFDAAPLTAEQTAVFGDRVSMYLGDLLVPESLSDAMKSCAATCIIHTGMVLTSSIAPTGLLDNSDQLHLSAVEGKRRHQALVEVERKVNIEGMRTVLSAALESTVTQLVYVGNADIVFDGRDRPMLREVDAPYPATTWARELEPRSHGERMVLSFNGVNALRTAVIRPAQLYGPGYTPRVVGHQFGDNTNLVDRTYVGNAAHAAILAAERLAPAHPQHAATAGHAFFITDGDPHPFWDFDRALWAAAGNAPAIVPGKMGQRTALMLASIEDMVGNWRGESPEMWRKIRFMCATRTYDISCAREVLGYAPIVGHEEGIRRTAEWWLERQLKICKSRRSVTDAATSENHRSSSAK